MSRLLRMTPITSAVHDRTVGGRMRIRETRLFPSIALRRRRAAAAAAAAAADTDAAATTTSTAKTSSPASSSSTTAATATTTASKRPVLILFDLDNAPIPSAEGSASAVVAVLARKMRSMLSSDDDDDDDRGKNNAADDDDKINNLLLSVSAEAFANEATLRSRPDLPPSLADAGIPLTTAPSAIRNAADAMVVSCAARALPRLGAGRGGLVVIGNDTGAYAEFLRFASSRGVKTLVAGDFDHGKKKNNNGAGQRGSGRRRWEGGIRGGGGGGGSSSSSSGSGSDVDVVDSDSTATTAPSLPPWRRKELPAAADHAVLWLDVLSEARELLVG